MASLLEMIAKGLKGGIEIRKLERGIKHMLT